MTVPRMEIRHRAAIGGYVSDAVSGAAIAGATVELKPGGLETKTQGDGFYHYLDLPDGLYTLQAKAPALGTRYGTGTPTDVEVASDAAGQPKIDPKGNLALPPTRLTGVVRRSGTLAAIAYAEVRLRASNVKTRSSKLGQYAFSAAQAGTQTVQVSALGFVARSQPVTLRAGEETVVDFSLTPA